MAGRHLWLPSCRTIGAARSPSLLVVKEPCLPSHHHHHQLDFSPHINNPSFLDSGMMGREVMVADRQSPSCGNIPPRKSAAPTLPVKETNDGHVTSDSGGSLSAGTLSPTNGGGFLLAGALSPSNDGGPSSIGPSPDSCMIQAATTTPQLKQKSSLFLVWGCCCRGRLLDSTPGCHLPA
jgi:hypothetical protein